MGTRSSNEPSTKRKRGERKKEKKNKFTGLGIKFLRKKGFFLEKKGGKGLRPSAAQV